MFIGFSCTNKCSYLQPYFVSTEFCWHV
uniref:Uncharacterized protein n=1 Tax=Arundo donax TaxID=35708 RepID=A0A0A9AJC9_ARUDO